jgi:hypothetical protein
MFLPILQASSQDIKDYNKFLLSQEVYNQTWLNLISVAASQKLTNNALQ